MSVSIDTVAPAASPSGVGVTFADNSPGSTVSGLSNSALVMVVAQLDGLAAITGMTATWDSQGGGTNQAMTLIGSASNITESVWVFGLRNPTVRAGGTTTFNWTGAAQIKVCGISFSGVDQTSDAAAFKNFTLATNAAPIAVTLTSPSGDIAVGVYTSLANFTSTNGTQAFIENTGNTWAAAGNYIAGAGSTTLSGSPGSAVHSLGAAIDVAASGAPPAQADVAGFVTNEW